MARVLGILLVGALLWSCSSAAPVPSVPPRTASDAPRPSLGPATTEPSPVASQAGDAVGIVPGLVYATIDAGGNPLDLELDLYLPAAADPVPVLVFLHGGGWVEGERDGCPADDLVKAGYGVACIDYRLARQDCARWAMFPGAVLDVRTAVDWLRQHATEYGLDATRVGLYGGSAGGHLATLTGLSYGVPRLATGDGARSMPVQAIVDWFGPSDFLTAPVQFEESPCGTALEDLETKYGEKAFWTWYAGLFLGGGFGDPAVVERAKLAAPGHYADPTDPPVLVIHGEDDPVVPISQSELLVDRLKSADLDVTFVRLPGFQHSYSPRSGPEVGIAPEFLEPTLEFLDRTLGG
jgi:acetyl esterase/lipase